MKYLRIFEKESDYTQYIVGGDDYVTPHVALVRDTNVVKYQIYEPLEDNYLTIEALEDDLTVSFSLNTIQYSIDNCQTWNELPADTTTPAINAGDKISFKATGLVPNSPGLTRIILGGTNGIGTFTVDKNFNLKGNVMSMLFGDEGKNNYDLTGYDYAFSNLFSYCDTLQSVSKNFLPATTLVDSCYEHMFEYCSSLVTAPELPATTLADSCYSNMFFYCSSLVTAPELPATTLADYCYYAMFYGCSSLTAAPELPATTLADSCYYEMFRSCTSLTTAPELPVTELAHSCYNSMFTYCYSLTTVPELPATELTYSCYADMFRSCSSLTTAPELPATTLADNCYSQMFGDCGKLNYIKALFTTTPGYSYTSGWVAGVSPTGTFVKNADATWDVTGRNGIPEGWTVETATA